MEARLTAGTPVVPWQSLDLEPLGLTEAEVTAAAYWIDAGGGLHRGHLAIGRALVSAGGLWGLIGRIVITAPLSWIARPAYALVARYRYKLPGSTDACRLPR